MFGRLRKLWLRISLKKKLGSFAAMVILVMGASAAFAIGIMNFSLGSFNVILEDNSKCNDLQEALELEIRAFEAYVRERSAKAKEEYTLACVRTERCIRSLPFEYERIGEMRYARTWNVKNGYEGYRSFRDECLLMEDTDEAFIPCLYRVYAMQSYLQTYARRLVQVTLQEGNKTYQEKVPVFYNMPYLILLCAILMMVVALGFTKLLSDTLVEPLVKLARSTRKIAGNDFGEQDVTVENQDEMGELVAAFNKMKHATNRYINTLKENNEMAKLLLKEELDKIEMEKRLEAERLELLKSQINPHFLFNTLNMISGMAKLEEAYTTERMISSMSNLFRYNLKTLEQTVPLVREMKVVQDYMYIQQMRFGSRISYGYKLEVDAKRVIAPAFILQPVVENAIVHGVSKKEQGGRVFVRVWKKGEAVVISVADTGVGMDEQRRLELIKDLKDRQTAKVGIGLGNIYQRIHTMYQGGSLEVYGVKGRGTVIQMTIPQAEEGGVV